MPKFEVVLTHTVIKVITLEMSAKDDDAAHDKAEKLIEKLEWDPDKIADEAEVGWEEDQNDLIVDSVQEL